MSDVKRFLEKVQVNRELTTRVQNASSSEELAALAASAGFDIPASAFAGIQAAGSGQMSEAELAGVAGGRLPEKPITDPVTHSGVTRCCWTA
jgi:predicted ribosomally synthesized peptide with nif11-like leader